MIDFKKADLNNYLILIGMTIPILIPIAFAGSSLFSNSTQHDVSILDKMIWPVRSQYNSLVSTDHQQKVYNADLMLASFFEITSFVWSVVAVSIGLHALKKRDRYEEILHKNKMSYSSFAIGALILGVGGIYISTMKDSYHIFAETTPLHELSPRVFFATATFMFFTGFLFLTEGVLFCVWWVIRGRRQVIE